MNENVNYLGPVSEASVEDRSNFIWKCYAHVVGAILSYLPRSRVICSSLVLQKPWLCG